MSNLGITISTLTLNNLLAGDFPRLEKAVIIKNGQNVLAKGTVLGKFTAGKYGAYDDTDQNGLGTARCILAEDVEATDGDISTTAYFTGEFNGTALIGLDANAKIDFEFTAISIVKAY